MSCTPSFTYSVSGFKEQFYRSFSCIDDWSELISYDTGDIIFYTSNNKFYKCLADGVLNIIPSTNPLEWEFISYAQANQANYISSKDVNSAFIEAIGLYDESLFCNENKLEMFYYLTAHFLVLDLRGNGINSSSSSPIASKSAGNVSISYAVPEWTTKNAQYSFLAETYYGKKYLSTSSGSLKGALFLLQGGSTPY